MKRRSMPRQVCAVLGTIRLPQVDFTGLIRLNYRWPTGVGGADLSRDYQHRERLGNDNDNTDTRAHFLRILSMAFPLASSSTSLSR